MSIFYDHRAKRPQIWTYPFFIILTAALFCLIYFYGMKKGVSTPSQPEVNSLSEGQDG
ncbi:MAG: hypothetical protein HQL16_04010 [Candidatus Omnitrophica bacterium]|nr:hypothetical protein [Candidatus Omnitrophota bacterium]